MDKFIEQLDMLPHNYEAYQKVMAHYESGIDKAAVVHATGTGKSYIIAAVAHHFKNVLIIAPNTFVLNETRKVCEAHVTFRTYMSVMNDYYPRTDYDLIVLDEFHRAGAEKWGLGVQNIISANTDAKLLGTSATAIRYLDNERNMADEIFDGEVVSSIPLKEALDRKLLPMPTYVSALYSVDADVNKRLKRLAKRKYKHIPENSEYTRKLYGFSKNWDNSHGVPAIIRKYLSRDTKRMIVFCSNVSRAEKSRIMLGSWFASAGFKNIRFYNIDYKNKYVEREMKDYELDNYDGLKVAISVDMLNEGIHIPRVDAIIMLRSTYSRIIIEQQVGRCLTSNNKGITPVVFDLVNNMDSIGYSISGWDAEGNIIQKTESEENEGFLPFIIKDENRDIRIFLTQVDEVLKRDSTWYDKYLPLNQKFYEKYGRLPTGKEYATCYRFNIAQRTPEMIKKYPHRCEWLKAHGLDMNQVAYKSAEERMDILEKALKEVGGERKLMTYSSYVCSVWQIFKAEYLDRVKPSKQNRKKTLTPELTERFAKLYDEYSNDWFPRMRRIKKIVLDSGYKALSYIDRDWLRQQIQDATEKRKIELIDSFRDKINIKKVSRCHDDELVEFLNKNHRLPRPCEDKVVYATAARFKRVTAQKKNPKLFKLLIENGFDPSFEKRPPREDFNARCNRIMNYCIENKVYVNQMTPADYCFYRDALEKHSNEPIVQEMNRAVVQFRKDDRVHPHNMNHCNNMLADVKRIGAMGYLIPAISKYGRWYTGQVNSQLRRGIPKPEWYEELKSVAHFFINKNNMYDKTIKRWNDDINLDNELKNSGIS